MSEYIVPNSGIVLYLSGEMTFVVVVTDTLLSDGRTLNTPTLKLYNKNLMDECGEVVPDENQFVCSFDFRNAMQLSQFLYNLISDDNLDVHRGPAHAKSIWISSTLYGGLVVEGSVEACPLEGVVEEYPDGCYQYCVLIKQMTDVDDVYDEKLLIQYYDRIKVFADILRGFALNRHTYYHEYLMATRLDSLRKFETWLNTPSDINTPSDSSGKSHEERMAEINELLDWWKDYWYKRGR